MKKIFYTFLLLTSFGFNLYLLNTEVVVQDDFSAEPTCNEAKDEVKIAQSAVKKAKMNQQHQQNMDKIREAFSPPSKEKKKAENDKKEEKSPADYDREYEQARRQWTEEVSQHLEERIGLSSYQVDRYFEINQLRESAINEYLKPRLEESRGQPYFFTVEDNVAIGKINENHIEMLRSEFGEDGYQRYVEFRKEYNRNLSNSDKSHFMYMEF